MQKASSGKLEDPEVGDLVNGIDPLWVLVDRVIAQQEKQGTFCCVPCFHVELSHYYCGIT